MKMNYDNVSEKKGDNFGRWKKKENGEKFEKDQVKISKNGSTKVENNLKKNPEIRKYQRRIKTKNLRMIQRKKG